MSECNLQRHFLTLNQRIKLNTETQEKKYKNVKNLMPSSSIFLLQNIRFNVTIVHPNIIKKNNANSWIETNRETRVMVN